MPRLYECVSAIVMMSSWQDHHNTLNKEGTLHNDFKCHYSITQQIQYAENIHWNWTPLEPPIVHYMEVSTIQGVQSSDA